MTKAKKKSHAKPTYTTLQRENRLLRAEVAKWHALSDAQDKVLATLKLTHRQIELERLSRAVFVAGEKVLMEPMAFALLEQLLLHQGEVLTKEFLIAQLWDVREAPGSDMLPVVAHKLRRALGPAGNTIQVARGQGYTIPKDEVAT